MFGWMVLASLHRTCPSLSALRKCRSKLYGMSWPVTCFTKAAASCRRLVAESPGCFTAPACGEVQAVSGERRCPSCATRGHRDKQRLQQRPVPHTPRWRRFEPPAMCAARKRTRTHIYMNSALLALTITLLLQTDPSLDDPVWLPGVEQAGCPSHWSSCNGPASIAMMPRQAWPQEAALALGCELRRRWRGIRGLLRWWGLCRREPAHKSLGRVNGLF